MKRHAPSERPTLAWLGTPRRHRWDRVFIRGVRWLILLAASFAVVVDLALSKPSHLEIPDARWPSIYLQSIDSVSSKAQWKPLRTEDITAGSIEIRVWFGFGRSPLECFRLRRDGQQWSGSYVREALEREWPFEIRTTIPRTSWANLWTKLESAGILSLPDSASLAGGKTLLDGDSYVVEINDGDHYRTYRYQMPQLQPWPEAQKLTEIAELLRAELFQPILADRFKVESATWPKTRHEAVDRLLSSLSDADKEVVRQTPKDELIRFHFGWGMGIRNDFGLWKGNQALLDDCGASHPDDASMAIIEATWRRLQAPFPLRAWRTINGSWTSRSSTVLVAILLFIVGRDVWRRARSFRYAKGITEANAQPRQAQP